MNNLSIYGIDPKKFCHEIQTGVATSAVIVNNAAECEGFQVLVQGNQVNLFSLSFLRILVFKHNTWR